jgi:hypothetical protein
MKKILLLALLCFGNLSAEDVVGLWKIPDEKTGHPRVIVAVYAHQNKYYGRVIAAFDKEGTIDDSIYAPISRSPRLVGDPFYSGMDIIWNLQKKGSKYCNGEILDPKRGKVYNLEIWRKGVNLIVRGKLMCFGKNMTWHPVEEGDLPQGFIKPDLTQLIPSIPKIK